MGQKKEISYISTTHTIKATNFLGNIPNSYTTKEYFEYYMMANPSKKPEKESDVVRLNHYSYKTEKKRH